MKVIFTTCFAFLAFGTSSAWWSRSEERTATSDGSPVDQRCEVLGNEGSCNFFDCFEQRLPCGREFYMQKYGNHYCNRFARAMNTFTSQGQEFLRNSQRCVTQRLLEYYRRDYVNCHSLEHAAIDLITPCYTEHGFCDVFSDNAQAFMQVFQLDDLFRSGAGKLWRELFELARTCGGQAFQDFMAVTGNNVSAQVRRFLSIFDK